MAAPTRSTILLALWGLAVLALAGWTREWPSDNRIARWSGQLGRDPGLALLEERFGGDEFALVRARGADAELFAVQARLEELRGVSEVVSALVVPGTHASGVIRWDALEQDPVIRELDLADPDGTRLDFLVTVAPGATPEDRLALAEALGALEADTGASCMAAGHPLVAAAIEQESAKVEQRATPTLLGVAAVALLIGLRSGRRALCCLLLGATASLLVRAVGRTWIGPSDLLLVTAGPVAFVLALASGLHLVLRHAQRVKAGDEPAQAARRALTEKLPACILAGLTTAAGFGVFGLSEVASVARPGALLAGSSLVTPALLPLVAAGLAGERPKGASPSRVRRAWRWGALAGWSRTRRVPILGATLALAAGALWAASHQAYAANGIALFPPSAPVRQAYDALEDQGATLSTVELLVRAEVAPPGLGEALAQGAGIRRVFGPELVERALTASNPLAALTPVVRAAQQRAGRLDREQTLWRWTVGLDAGADPAAAVASLRSSALEVTDEERMTITGSVPFLVELQQHLARTLASSLAWTAALTGALFLLVTRSPRALLAAMVANLFPVAAVVASMGLLAIPVDPATVMVAAIVLGLAVDGTLHLVHRAAAGGEGPGGKLAAFDEVGGALTVGAFALLLGFGSLAPTEFLPTSRFGLLCALGIAAAWIGDLLVLPALWLEEQEPA
ncbi:MAG: MMPL family transporter [Planctomycetes bacterium]|nr:MMPL family transporter [Planctomycetota bacterium]